jgi:hypothetical protein
MWTLKGSIPFIKDLAITQELCLVLDSRLLKEGKKLDRILRRKTKNRKEPKKGSARYTD